MILFAYDSSEVYSHIIILIQEETDCNYVILGLFFF